jgi:hypothetical protein
MNVDALLDLTFAMNDQPTARRVLFETFERWADDVYAELFSRIDHYEQVVAAALPTMATADADRLAAAWQGLKEWHAATTDEERRANEAQYAWVDEGIGNNSNWIAPLIDAVEAACPMGLSDDEVCRLADVAGPALEWWPTNANR